MVFFQSGHNRFHAIPAATQAVKKYYRLVAIGYWQQTAGNKKEKQYNFHWWLSQRLKSKSKNLSFSRLEPSAVKRGRFGWEFVSKIIQN